ncbi:hypothetical protein TRFO_02857 [Tritrichomonas foetus]|uniref:Uncharacterized protein n=1 Tax=Tritrichomonas foetus TaxID=1144522 RepID=A0A1J4KXB6_9EUKA|nr:hypothetical protein TRFO_02857 [Tritrichomonas foetus]|eukprot:OHT15528.1 hypothetical protein TRFO_02857 [Tritrichomonas foetus]
MNIDEMLNKKVKLPPITGLVGDMPQINVPIERLPDPPKPTPLELQFPKVQNTQQEDSNDESGGDSGRSAPYTLHDDLSIFKVVASYYGFGFHGKIPWSFWQTYKKATGSTRSNSSLYHHWNGAMKKKYEAFITNGRLSDCILWLETAVMAEQIPPNSTQPLPHAGTPLCHNRSQPSVPLIVGQQNIAQEQPLSLIRTSSCFNDASLPFVQFH